MTANRPYLFYELTNSICSRCLVKVEAKVIVEEGKVYLLKLCPSHRYEKVLISDDAEYYQLSKKFIKPGQLPHHFNTPEKDGCPYDCGLCPGHEQHSCLTIVEITDRCNLNCPVCYAESGTHRTSERSLTEVEWLLDRVVDNEGNPDVVQISGGEPTIHPQFFEILAAAKKRPIKHLMVNTNGIKIANEPGFAERLASFLPNFEIYLQFDSLEENHYPELRGASLLETKLKAIEKLNALNLSTTLVMTLKAGLNVSEIGRVIDFASRQKAVRGVTLQPVQVAGRTEGFDPATDRLTLSEVRREILRQAPVFQPEDVIPVPCHPDCLGMAYALKRPDGLVPLTSLIDPQILVQSERSTIVFEQDKSLKDHFYALVSTGNSPESAANCLKELLCCLPEIAPHPEFKYDDVFRVLIVQFMDAYSLDVRSVKRSCIHIVHSDGRIIPFDTYNLFYRAGKESLRDNAIGRINGTSTTNQPTA